MEKTTPCIAGGGLLAAIAAVLRLVGSAIRFGPFSVSLVLIPLVPGCRLFFMPLIHQWAQQAGYAGAGAYLMVGMVGCPCTLVIAGGLGRFVAPRCRREAVCDEDLLLRGLWKLCTANCPSADKP